MKKIRNINLLRTTLCVLFLIGSLVYASKPSVSDEYEDRRLTAGAKIFRALLAADLDIETKTGRDGNLRICLLYTDDERNAELVDDILMSRDDTRIKNHDLTIEVLPPEGCIGNNKDQRFAGIFLTQSLSDTRLSNLLADARQRNTVIFSPLEGDVERGVLGGLAVEARVRPYLNINTLKRSDIRLSPFFMRVSKQYEE